MEKYQLENKLNIRWYKDGDEDFLIPLFNKIFLKENPNHVIMDKKSWNWKFKNNPAGFKILVASSQDSEIVGQMALKIDRIKYYNTETSAYTINDVCLDENFRNNHFTSQCFEYFLPETKLINWGFPSEEVIPTYQKTIPNLKIIDVPIFHKLLIGSASDSLITIEPYTSENKEIDNLWQTKKNEIEVGVIRDWDYVNWRIINGPEKMELFIIKNNNKVIGYLAMVKNGDLCLINDILLLNDYVNIDTLKQIENKCLENKGQEIRIMATDNYLKKLLLENGFKQFSRDEIKQKGYFIYFDPEKPNQEHNIYLTWSDADWYLYD